MTITFLPGLQLCEQFYWQAVQPILDAHFPRLPHAAARLESGSEVLGFDAPMSTDHDWGPRLQLFLCEDDQPLAPTIWDTLAIHLPHEFSGYPTNFTPPDPTDNGTQLLQATHTGPVNHRVQILTAQGFFQDHLGFDLSQRLTPADWLTFPEQKLRTLTAGAVYHDGIGLNEIRGRFASYPHDVWLYLLAAGWARIGEEEHLMGRAGLAGDEVGSALIGARLIRDVMRLCFLMERVYAPYPKWFGTAFRHLTSGPELYPVLHEALAARTWQERERHLIKAYEFLAARHNALALTEPLPEKVQPFFNRPFQVITHNGIIEALLKQIVDPEVQRIAQHRLIGSLDLFSDNTALLSHAGWREKVREIFT